MTDKQPAKNSPRVARPCPICVKMSIEKYYPFCSLHCANVDLHHWLKGSYAIPAEEGAQEGFQGENEEVGKERDEDN